MKKVIAVKFILLIIVIIFVCWGCGKDAAEIALVEKDVNAAEESKPEESPGDEALSDKVTPETTPVIEVICNCQCNAGTSVQNAETQPGDVIQQPVDDGKVNINTADVTQLQTLNGIGASRAQAIISYRESYGLFQSIEEIKNVDGIKDGVYSKIKDEISVGR